MPWLNNDIPSPEGRQSRFGGEMTKTSRRAPRLVGLFLLGCLLFNYPMLALFNVRASVFGIPLLYAYLFAAWALLIALVAIVMERGD